eukprot:639418-Rhodomonas_salina.5
MSRAARERGGRLLVPRARSRRCAPLLSAVALLRSAARRSDETGDEPLLFPHALFLCAVSTFSALLTAMLNHDKRRAHTSPPLCVLIHHLRGPGSDSARQGLCCSVGTSGTAQLPQLRRRDLHV